MIILNRLSSRIDISLSLIVTKELTSALRKIFLADRELLTAAVTVAVLLSSASSAIQSDDPKRPIIMDSLSRLIALFRRLSVLVISDLALGMIKPVTSQYSQESMGRDLRLSLRPSLISTIPLTAIEPLEAFAISSCLIVLIGFLARQTEKIVPKGIPELQRLYFSIQYLFADTIGSFLVDREMARIVTSMGIVSISAIVSHLGEGADTQTPFHMWVGGIAMAWVNVIVSLMVPDVRGNTSPFTDIIGAISLLVGLQAMNSVVQGISTLSGYVEWHLATVITAAAKADGAQEMDVVIAAGIVLGCITFVQKTFSSMGAKGFLVSIPYGITSLLAVNNAATLVIAAVKNSNVLDSILTVTTAILLVGIGTRFANVLFPD